MRDTETDKEREGLVCTQTGFRSVQVSEHRIYINMKDWRISNGQLNKHTQVSYTNFYVKRWSGVISLQLRDSRNAFNDQLGAACLKPIWPLTNP